MSAPFTPRPRPQAPDGAPHAVSLAALETATVASGIRVADAVVKMAPVALLYAQPVSPGKFVVVFAGTVGDVAAAAPKGLEAAGAALTDSLVLAQCHGDVHRVLAGLAAGPAGDALGVIETDGVPSTLLAADRAAKTAPVRLRTIRLADGLGGRGFILFDGTLSDVNAAVAAARSAVGAHLVDSLVVPRLAEPVRDRLY
jgi:microcompartment protein CcmL/EutN